MAIELSHGIDAVTRTWLPIAEIGLGCAVRIDLDTIQAYPWGWVLSVVPVNQELCPRAYKIEKYAVDRQTGITTPVGTKGVEDALVYFAKQREMLREG